MLTPITRITHLIIFCILAIVISSYNTAFIAQIVHYNHICPDKQIVYGGSIASLLQAERQTP